MASEPRGDKDLKAEWKTREGKAGQLKLVSS